MYAMSPKVKALALTGSMYNDGICNAGINMLGIAITKSSRSNIAVPTILGSKNLLNSICHKSTIISTLSTLAL